MGCSSSKGAGRRVGDAPDDTPTPPDKIGQWQCGLDEDGRRFYWHEETRETTWDPPEEYTQWFANPYVSLHQNMLMLASPSSNRSRIVLPPKTNINIDEDPEVVAFPSAGATVTDVDALPPLKEDSAEADNDDDFAAGHAVDEDNNDDAMEPRIRLESADTMLFPEAGMMPTQPQQSQHEVTKIHPNAEVTVLGGPKIDENLVPDSEHFASTPAATRDDISATPTVYITGNSYEPEVLVVEVGTVITWDWAAARIPQNVRQVALRKGDPHPVIGGLDSEQVVNYDQTSFNGQLLVAGTYWFQSYACRVPYMKVVVLPCLPTLITVQDSGFETPFVQVPRGLYVKISWPDVSETFALSEFETDEIPLCAWNEGNATAYETRCLYPGTRTFSATSAGVQHQCTVYVQQAPTTHVITFDRLGNPSPMLQMAMVGDTILFDWSGVSYDVLEEDLAERPLLAHFVVECGTGGIIRARADEPGSEYAEDEADTTDAPMRVVTLHEDDVGVHTYRLGTLEVGTMTVFPALKMHHVGVAQVPAPPTASAFGACSKAPEQADRVVMDPPVLYACRGDSCEWAWTSGDAGQSVRLVLRPTTLKMNLLGPAVEEDDDDLDGATAEMLVEQWHLFQHEGVYECCLEEDPNTAIGMIVVQNGAVDALLSVDDGRFEQSIVHPHPEDRLWWRWEGCRNDHAIMQISFQKEILPREDAQAQLRLPTGAYNTTIKRNGVFYFISMGHEDSSCCVVMALMKPQTHIVKASAHARWKDSGNTAILAHRDDNIVWSANDDMLDDEDESIRLERVKGDGESFTAQEIEELELDGTCFVISPTNPTNIKLTNTGAFHFSIGDTIRTVIVDERMAASVRIEVSQEGAFYPASMTVEPNTTVCWTWNGELNEQRIFQCDSEGNELENGFNSGELDCDTQYAHTFSELGVNYISTGQAVCRVITAEVVPTVGVIQLHSNKSSSGSLKDLKLGDELVLTCESRDADIFFTVDGTEPTMLNGTRYVMGTTTIRLESFSPFIRAMAVMAGHLPRKFISTRLFQPGFRALLLSTALLIQRWYKKWKVRKAARMRQGEITSGTTSAADTPLITEQAIDAIDPLADIEDDGQSSASDSQSDLDDANASWGDGSPQSAASRRLRPKSAKFKKKRTPSQISDLDADAANMAVLEEEVAAKTIQAAFREHRRKSQAGKQAVSEPGVAAAHAKDVGGNDGEAGADKGKAAEAVGDADAFPALDQTPPQPEARWLNILGLSCKDLPKTKEDAHSGAYVMVEACGATAKTPAAANLVSPLWASRKCPCINISVVEAEPVGVHLSVFAAAKEGTDELIGRASVTLSEDAGMRTDVILNSPQQKPAGLITVKWNMRDIEQPQAPARSADKDSAASASAPSQALLRAATKAAELEARNAALQAEAVAAKADAEEKATALAEAHKRQADDAAALEQRLKEEAAQDLAKKAAELEAQYQEKVAALANVARVEKQDTGAEATQRTTQQERQTNDEAAKNAAELAEQLQAREKAAADQVAKLSELAETRNTIALEATQKAAELEAEKRIAELEARQKVSQLESEKKLVELEAQAHAAELEQAAREKEQQLQGVQHAKQLAVQRANDAERKLKEMDAHTARDWSLNVSCNDDASPRKTRKQRPISVTAVMIGADKQAERQARVAELVSERSKVIRQIMLAVEKGKGAKAARSSKLADTYLIPYLNVVNELQVLLAEIETAKEGVPLVRLAWSLEASDSNSVREVEVLRNGKACMVLPPSTTSTTIECHASEDSTCFEVHAATDEASDSGDLLTGTVEVEHSIANERPTRFCCVPGMCDITDCAFEATVAREAKFLSVIRGKPVRASQKLRDRFIKLGSTFPLSDVELGLRWLDAPVTMLVFWSPSCPAAMDVVQHVRLLMESIVDCALPAVQETRCILVASQAEEAETVDALKELGCASINNTLSMVWKEEALADCGIHTIPTITLVGITGTVKYSGLEDPDDAVRFNRNVLRKIYAITGSPLTKDLQSPPKRLSAKKNKGNSFSFGNAR